VRFLFISTHFPKDPYSSVIGVFKRMNLFIDAIKEIGSLDMLFYVPHTVDIDSENVSKLEKIFSEYWKADIRLFLCHRFEQKKNLSHWRRYVIPSFNFFKQGKYIQTSMPSKIEKFKKCLTLKPDAIFAHRLSAMCPILLTNKKQPPVFFDMDDIEHVTLRRNISQPPVRPLKRLLYLQIPALKLGERRAIKSANLTFVCSEFDKKYLTMLWKGPKISNIPNSVNMPDIQPITKEPSMLFLGSYDYEPNKNAIEFFLDKIWHLIQKEIPQAHLIIAGSYPERINHYTKNPAGVEFTGFVEDVQQLYKRSRVICCPILAGSGTRVKIIEAAAYEKPIVTTTIGLEGIKMSDGKEVLIRDDAKSFSKACVQLLEDVSLCRQLGKAARIVAEKEYNRNKVIGKIQAHILSTFN